ncbi:unnamed protein product [Caenorhabditis bovis]|uniref:PIPK domain-containing protein n=1 Tax=Caenorhabditis bovis TaxID=2654633 RepID=A0A8S1F3N0_9PELO|nr:unnamed protein product [Caenorhabditis bovis]
MASASITFKTEEDEEGEPPSARMAITRLDISKDATPTATNVIRPEKDASQVPIINSATSTGNVTSREPQSQMKEKLGHRRIDEQGEVSYKKVPTNALMMAIQLGIANSIGSLASLPNRDVLLQDFEKVDIVSFPASGSATTPSHSFGDFRFRTYAPIAFRYFRNLFHIKPADFLRSICTEPLKELANAGASGSIFYVSQDDQFIVKTVQHKEAEFLQKLLPGYYMNLNQNPRTLLPKFFGLFCYQSLGKNIRLLVMNNLLPQTITMHEKYDLKGSTYKRCASKAERAKVLPTLKDLDFLENHREGILIDPVALDALIKTISRDCLVLESFKIMDYSLLVGIHNLEIAARTKAEKEKEEKHENGGPTTSKDGVNNGHKPLQEKYSVWETGDVDLPQCGVPARNSNGDRLVLYLGIIDILQNYRLLKKFEHTWKAILHDGDSISVHNPNFYAQRFLNFMQGHVFKKGPALKSSPSRKRTMLKNMGASGDEDQTITSASVGQKYASNDGYFGSQTARESTRLYSARKETQEDQVISARDVHPIMPSSNMSRVPLRRSYREGGQQMSTEKKEKKVERLFASPAPAKPGENQPLVEEKPEEEEEEIMSVDRPDEKFLALWRNSDEISKQLTAQTGKRDLSIGEARSNIWSNFSALSASDQTQMMSRLSTNWPFAMERRALTWPVHAGLIANCFTSSMIATRINSDVFLFDPKTKFLESVQKCPKSPFVFGIYSAGVTYYMLYQMFITPKVYNEMSPCPTCVVINSIVIGLVTGILIPMLATPYLTNYVLLQREGASSKQPAVKNLLEFLTLGWEGSRGARPIIAQCAAIQMVVSFASMYALLWGRERMFNTLEYDAELAKKLISETHESTSVKQKILDYLRKIPMISGIIDDAPEKERVL